MKLNKFYKHLFLTFIFIFPLYILSQVDAKKYKDGVLLKERDNIFKSVKFDRNNLKIIVTWESYNGVKISIEYKALNSQTITARGDKCTSIEVIDKDGLYTTFVFVHNYKKVYMLEDGYETHFTGQGVKYE